MCDLNILINPMFSMKLRLKKNTLSCFEYVFYLWEGGYIIYNCIAKIERRYIRTDYVNLNQIKFHNITIKSSTLLKLNFAAFLSKIFIHTSHAPRENVLPFKSLHVVYNYLRFKFLTVDVIKSTENPDRTVDSLIRIIFKKSFHYQER